MGVGLTAQVYTFRGESGVNLLHLPSQGAVVAPSPASPTPPEISAAAPTVRVDCFTKLRRVRLFDEEGFMMSFELIFMRLFIHDIGMEGLGKNFVGNFENSHRC